MAEAKCVNSVVLGDVDGDGDLDAVTGDDYEENHLYLNNGTADPFGGVSGIPISTDVDETQAVALSDVDLDGDLDLFVGNNGGSRSRAHSIHPACAFCLGKPHLFQVSFRRKANLT